MNRKNLLVFVFALMLLCSSLVSAYSIVPTSPRAIIVADNIVAWQTESGGWNKNVDYSVVMYEPGMSKGNTNRHGQELGTFDNDASLDEMRFLAMMWHVTKSETYRASFIKGLEWMLDAQYPSGGWPQYYPLRDGYWDQVTYNDNAMSRILTFIQEVINQPRTYSFLEEDHLPRLEAAYEKGIEYILKSQIEVNGHLTVWCQQHDPVTYEPRMGRAYEHPSQVSAESASVVQFLMSLPNPSEEIRRSILSALEWFELAELPDGRWARFYDIESNVPIYSGRDSVIRYQVTDIELERQQGYSWSNNSGQKLLADAKSSGYMEQLRESLPDHVSITLDAYTDPAIPKFNSPRIMPTPTVSGDLNIDIEISMRNPENFEEVVILLNNKEIYCGDDLHVRFLYDTTGLMGRQYLLVETSTKDGVVVSHGSSFIVNN